MVELVPCKRRRRKYDPIARTILASVTPMVLDKIQSELSKRKPRRTRRKLDPQKKLPKPKDFRGFDHTMIRVVEPIDKLIEAQIMLPSHVWNKIAETLKEFGDVEIDQKVGRIVRRGRDNKATNIFLDKET